MSYETWDKEELETRLRELGFYQELYPNREWASKSISKIKELLAIGDKV